MTPRESVFINYHPALSCSHNPNTLSVIHRILRVIPNPPCHPQSSVSSTHSPCHPRGGGDLVLVVLRCVLFSKIEKSYSYVINVLKFVDTPDSRLRGNDNEEVWNDNKEMGMTIRG